MGKSAKRSSRRFLPRETSPAKFFEALNAVGCRYVVLRWFNSLPHLDPGEDIDILVHDEDVDKVRALLTPRPMLARLSRRKNLVRCDVYSVSGLAGSAYKGVAYYPPHLAQGILERAEHHPSGAMVPSTRDYFYSLAFHALYQKGVRSGLPVADPAISPNSNPEHDYCQTLQQLADQLAIPVRIEMNALDNELARAGWRPPIDFMERVLPDDAWVLSQVAAKRSTERTVNGLAVFIVRERALDHPSIVEEITELLDKDGFNILAVSHLPAELRNVAEREIRGGNWGTGPWLVAGGRPAVAIAALDVFPIAPDKRLRKHHPRADNARVFASKDRIRDRANRSLPPHQRTNIVHSSDNAGEAAAHLRMLFPENHDAICDAAAQLSEVVCAPGEVVRRLNRSGRNAIVEIIRRDDGSIAVCKRFRPGKENFFKRELHALSTLRAICPDVVPDILERGQNYIVIPYYKDVRRRIAGVELPIPVMALRKAFLAAQTFFEHGFELRDFRPHNLIVEGKNRVKIIDYEEAYEISPSNGRSRFGSLRTFQPIVFDNDWGRAVGLSLQSLLNDPPWRLYLKRWTVGYPMACVSVFRKARRNLARSIARRRERIAVKNARRAATGTAR